MLGSTWIHGDQLGSASLMTDGDGNAVGPTRYKLYREKRSDCNIYLSDNCQIHGYRYIPFSLKS